MAPLDALTLIGRSGEVSKLSDAVRTARRRASLVLIEGSAGFGKSALLMKTLREASGAGFSVAAASISAEPTADPFAPLWLALDSGRQAGAGQWDERADAFVATRATTRARSSSTAFATTVPAPLFALVNDARWQAIDRLCEVLANVSTRCPHVLAIDDLHWADPSTILALRSIRRRLHDLPLLIVGATRPVLGSERGAAMQDLEDDADQVITLGALSHDHSHALAELRLDEFVGRGSVEARSYADQVTRLGAGSPLLITQLCSELKRHTERRPSAADNQGVVLGSAEQVDGLDHGAAVAHLVAARLAELGASAVDTVRCAAVLGTSVPMSDLREMLDPAIQDQLADSVFALRSVGLFLSADTRRFDSSGSDVSGVVRFAHDLFRDEVARTCTPSELARMHSRAAEVVAARGGAAGVVAWHLGVGQPVDRPATSDRRSWLIHAANEAAPTSPGLAARLLGEALIGVDLLDEDGRAAFVALIGYLASSGRVRESEQLIRGLLSVTLSVADELVLRWWLSSILFASGRLVEGLGVAEEGLERSRDDLTKARLSALVALIKVLQLDPGFGVALEAAEVAAVAANDASATTIVGCLRSRLAANELRISSSLELAEAAVESADRDLEGLAHRYQPLFFLCLALLDRADRPALTRQIALGRRRASQTGTSWAECLYLAMSGQVAWREGRFDDALADARAAVATAEDTAVTVGVVIAHATCALVFAFRGDYASAAESVAAGEAGLQHDPLQVGVDILASAVATCRIVSGDSEAGIEHAVASAEFFASVGFRTSSLECLQPALWFLHRSDDPLRWLARIDALVASQRKDEDAFLAPYRCIARAYRTGSPVAWREAVAATDQQGWPLRSALVRAAGAASLARLGDDTDVSLWAREAEERLTIFTAFEPARRISASTGRAVPRRSSSAILSPTERRIATLVAEGMSNREISEATGQSVRTVEAHVSSVLRKLDVPSRAKVAAMLRPNTL